MMLHFIRAGIERMGVQNCIGGIDARKNASDGDHKLCGRGNNHD